MKVKDIPQDKDEQYEGHSKIRYARDEKGNIIKVPSSGWSTEKEATQCAWDEIDLNLKSTVEKIEKGKLSPLAFHMEVNLFTPELLAQNLGMWTFILKRHLRPEVFSKLSDKKLQKYADFFEISINDLKSIPSRN